MKDTTEAFIEMHEAALGRMLVKPMTIDEAHDKILAHHHRIESVHIQRTKRTNAGDSFSGFIFVANLVTRSSKMAASFCHSDDINEVVDKVLEEYDDYADRHWGEDQ